MATSIYRKFKMFFYFSLSLFIIGFYSQILNAQTITNAQYITSGQNIITVTLSVPVTITNATGWSANVGGVLYPYNVNPLIRPNIQYLSGSGTNVLNFQLLFVGPKTSITPDDVAIGVNISYNGTGNTGPGMPAAGPFAAVNDVIIDCTMLTGVQNIGTNSSTGSCQPLTVKMKINWTWSMQARNSTHFNSTGINTTIIWGDATSGSYQMTENPVNSGIYEIITISHNYPINNVCSYAVNAYPLFLAKGGDAAQPIFACPTGTSRQTYVLPAYRLDNQLLGGSFNITPATGAPVTLFCVGTNITAFIFTDATTFNCNIGVEPSRPNQDMRWTQFIYGTNVIGGARIANVYINVFGTPVQLTDNAGNPMPNSWTVNPLDGTTIGAYSTPSGFFEGPIVVIPSPALVPSAQSYPINHTGNFSPDAANQKFEVTLRNWGPCNKYTDFATPIETQSQLRLIVSPAAPTPNNQNICVGSAVPALTVTGAPGVTAFYWYSNAALTIVAPGSNNTNTYNTGISNLVPSVTTFYVTQVVGGVNACVSPATPVVLTINPIPNQPTITRNNPDFCFDGVSSIILTANPAAPPAVSGYQWYRNGVAVGGATASTITLSTVAQSGSYTVISYGIAPTLCPSPVSAATTVNIWALATATAPANAAVCQTFATSFGITAGGAASTIQWQRFSGGWVNITGAAVPNDGCTYSNFTTATLNIANAVIGMNGFQYRAILTTVAGGCVTTSGAAILTVNPNPTITLGANPAVCSGTTTANLTYSATTGGANRYSIVYNAAALGAGFVNVANAVLPVSPISLVVPGAAPAATYIGDLTVTNSITGCVSGTYAISVTVNPIPTITLGANPAVCSGTTSANLTYSATIGAPNQYSIVYSGAALGAGFVNVANAVLPVSPISLVVPGAAPMATYTGDLTVTNSVTGCVSGTYAISVTINPSPTVNVGGAMAAICQGGTSALLGGSFGGGATSAVWTDGGAGGSFTNNGGATPNTATYTASIASGTPVTLTLTTGGGSCANTFGTKNITVNPNPNLVITNPAAVCAPSTVDLTAAAVTAGSTGGLNYTYWTDAGATIALGAPAAVNVSGTYYIKGTVVATGCFNIQPVVVAVNPGKPAVPTISGVSPVCQSQLGVGYSVPFDASVTNYVWSFDPILSATLLAPVNLNNITVNFSATSVSGNVRVTASNGCGNNGPSLPYAITVTPLPAATISYAGSPFCRTLGAGQAVTRTGTAGGAYSAAPAGLTIDAVTGAINPSTSTAGAYTVTYTIAAGGGCGIVTATTPVTITALPTAAISYTGSPWCTSAGVQNVTLVGTAGGAYSAAPAGLTIDAATGAITPGTSTAGTYTVTYTIAAAGGCAIVTATTSVTITALPSATISYAGSPFCKTLGAGQAVTRTGIAGGAYSAAPVGLTLDAATGAINPSTSTAGAYTVTYTIAAAGGCAIVTTTAAVTITTLPAATISYAGTPFCKTLVAGQSVTLTGTAGGTYSAAPAGLTIDAVTGAITPSTSTAGAYTVTYTIAAAGGCAVVTATTPVTITALPTATISYAGTPFCKTLGAGQAVTFTGTAGGAYSALPAGLTLDAATGAINPSTSAAGAYTVTYTIAAAGGCAVVTATAAVTITALPVATISYAGTPFCKTLGAGQPVTQTGTAGGAYSAAPAGLTLDAVTGAINPGTSTAGIYTVTYTIAAAGGCAVVTATTPVTITALPVATINYAGSPFCKTLGAGQAVTQTGTAGGAYSAAPAGLTIDAVTGAIDPGTSTAGAYTVTYTIAAAGGCAVVTTTAAVTITALPTATISYAGSPFCKTLVAGQSVTQTGTAGGAYSAAPAGLTLDAVTGAINPSTSTAGAYTVTYTIAAAGGCAVVTTTTPVTITALPVATINYAGSPFCKTLGAGQPVTQTGTAGGAYSAAPAGLTIDAITGAINPSTSTAGAYTVTYTIAAASGCAVVTATASVTITTLPAATISYVGSPFCKTQGAGQAVTLTGTAGGTYTAAPAGLIIDAVTGAINPSTSTAGAYTVTYTIAAAGGCAIVTTTTAITITALPVATINYAGSPFCKTLGAGQAVTQTGAAGGAYSAAPAGLTLDAVTGAINPGTSTAGVYTVTYTIAAAGGCAVVTATATVTITTLPVATISYAGSPFCKTLGAGQAVTQTGTAGGTYSALPAGLTLDAVTGAINPGTSAAGAYTVTYTIAAAGGCAIVTATAAVTITALPVATIGYAGTPFCKTLGAGQAVTQTGTAGGAYSAAPAGLTLDAVTGAINPGTSTAGIYTVTYTIAAAGGCAVVTATTSVTITTLPTAAISYTGSPWCSAAGGQNVTLVGTAGGVYSAAPAGLSIDAATGAITVIASTIGAYTVTYTIAAATGCAVVTATASVAITSTPVLSSSLTPPPICSNTAFSYTPTSATGGTTFNWTRAAIAGITPAGPTAGADNPNETLINSNLVPVPVTYVYTLNAGGCNNVQNVVVNVVPLPPTPAIGGGGKTAMCKGTNGQFYSVPLNAGNTYNWSIGPAGTTKAGGGNPADNFIVLNFPNPGVYTLSVQEFTSAPQICGGPIQTLTITVYDDPVADAGLPRTICEGVPTTLGGAPTASGGSGTFTYLWTPSFGLDDATLPNPVATTNATRTYTLNVNDVISGCATVIKSVVVTVNPLPTVYNVTGPDYYCFGTPGITLTLSGSQIGVNYQLYKDAVISGAVIAGTGAGLNWPGLTTGTYTVKATNAVTLCTNDMNGSITVAENPDVVINSITPIQPSCFSSSDGVIAISASGGTGALSYSVDNGVTYQTSGTFGSLIQGTYNIIVKDTRGCTKTAVQVLTQPPALSITSITVTTPIACFGNSNGSARVVVAGGTPGYTYIWYAGPGLTNPIGQTTDQATGLVAGTYWVKITDFNSCTISSNIAVTQPAILAATTAITSNYNGSAISCNGALDGSIAVTASGGTGGLSYLLIEQPANVTGAATGIFTGLAAGSYTVRVTDVNLCNMTTAPVTLTQPAAVIASTAITSNYNGSAISCNGATDGRITVTASGGTGALSYLLNEQPLNITGSINGIFTGLGAGSYTVRVRDLNLCTVNTVAVIITAPAAVTASALVTSNYNGSQLSCNGTSDGRITVTAGGGTGTLTYLLTQIPGNITGFSSGIFIGIPAGTYTVRVTDVNGCNVTTAAVTITNPAALTATGSVTSNYNGSQVSCNGSSDGVITVIAGGGTGVRTFVLDQNPGNVTGAASGIFTGLNASTYTVTVTDINGCTKTTGNIVVSNPSTITATSAITSNFNGSPISCNGATDGRIAVTASGGTGTLNYLLIEQPLNVTGVATGIFTGLAAGSYTVRVTDVNLCNITTTAVILTQPAAVTASTAITSNYNGSAISCNGATDGRITVTASGGTGALSYLLNEQPLNITGSINGIFTGLGAGSYTVQVRDLNLCTINTVAVVITAPAAVTASALVTSNYNGSQLSCNGASDGRITVTAGGGTGALTYLLIQIPGNVTGSASGVFTGVPAGTYTVRVSDLNGCNVTTLGVTISNPIAITAPISITSNYNGSRISCFGATDGIITVVGAGGTGALNYTLDQDPANVTGAATGVFTGLAAGTYTVTVKDINLCSKTTTSVTLNNPPAISALAAVTSNYNGSQVSCNGSLDGRITVMASGGTGALSYLLVEMPLNVTGAATGIFTGVGAGTYTIRVSDLNSCNVITAPVTISNPAAVTATALVTSSYNGRDLSCFGASDGRITVTASGGSGTLTYLLNEIPLNITGLNTGIFTGVPAGASYTIKVTDKNGCNVNTAPVAIVNPPAITATALVTSNYNGSQLRCNGSSDGEITVTAGGGTGAMNYGIVQLPGNLTGAATGVFTGIPAGTYTVRVTDVNGCNVTTAAVTITNPAALTAIGSVTSNYNGSQVSCNGSSDGAITVIAGGGTGVRTFVLDQNPGNVTGAASGIFTGLNAGTYTITVTDINACTKTTSNIIVSNPPAITATTGITSNYNGSAISCNGATDGRIAVTASGGTGILSYLLIEQPLNITGAATGIFTGLAAGSYTIRVTDVNLCNMTTAPVTLTQPAAIAASATVTSNYNGSQLSCNTSTDGRIAVTASGGTGALSYLLNEQPLNITGSVSGIFTGLGAGSYTVRVRDLNLCTVNTVAVVIAAPAALGITVNKLSNFNGRDISCFGAADGRVEAVVTGGTGSYSYNWYSDAAMTISIGQVTAVALNLSAGTYYVRVRDLNNCTTSGSVTLNQPVALDASITAQTNVVCYGGNTGSVTVLANPATGTAPYEYSINGGGSWFGSGTFTNLNASIYTVIAKDANGCLKQVPVTISQPGQLNGTVSKTDVSCFGANDGTITISAPSGGSGTYQYSVDGGSNWLAAGNISNLVPATYDVRIADVNNPSCSAILSPSLIITEPVKLGLTSTGDITLGCFGNGDGAGTFFASGGTMPYNFVVTTNTGATIPPYIFNSQSFFNAGAGTITATVTDFHGCSASAIVNVTQPGVLIPGTIGINQVVCAGTNPVQITETVPASGGPGAYNYQWQYGNTAAGPFFNIAGANAILYTPPAGALSTLYYRRMITSGLCLPVYSNVVEVLVNPKPVAVLTGGETICPSQSSILKVNMMVGTGPFELDIANFGTITGYVSGADIIVSPGVTTVYTLTRVRDANLCEVIAPSGNLLGSATVTVRALPAITSSPVSKTICEFGMVAFNTVATGTDLTYQWYVNTGSGFNPVADGGVYFGATNSTLSLFGATRLMTGYIYHVVVTGCLASVTSADATLTVNTVPEISIQPKDSTACLGAGATFNVTATGTAVTYQWQVNKGAGFINVTDDANFSGSALSTLTITNAQAAFNNYIFRVIVSGSCGVPVYSNFAVLRVNIPPTVTLNPVNKAICDGAGPVIFSANGSGMIDSMRWQVFNGAIWSDVHDNVTYSGSTSQQLTLDQVPLALNGYLYRLALKAKCTTVNTLAGVLTVNPNPVVNFSALDPIHACGNVPLVINGNPTGGSGTWSSHLWTGDVGPLNNFFIQSPTFNSQIAGTYLLNYKVKDNKGCSANGDVTVLVDAPDATFTQDKSNGCTPMTVTFTKDMTGLAKFRWDFGDGSPRDSVTANPVHTYTNASPTSIDYHNVKLTVWSPGGCTDSFTSSVTVYPAINATFTATPGTVCSGNQVIFTTLPGASKYFWDFGDGVSGYFTNTTNHLYTNFTTAAVVHTVTLTTTSFYNCTDVKTLDITAMPVPIPQFTALPATQVYNALGNSVVFTNTTNAGTWNWLWHFGDGATSTDQSPSHIYTDLGTYDVVLTVSNANCSDSVKHSVTITPIPPVANFDLIPSGCSPLTININNTSLNTNTPGTTYMWDFGDGGASTSKNPTYTYFTPGTYMVQLTVSGPGGISTFIQTQLVNAYPSPLVSFQVSPTTVFVNDQQVRMFNQTQFADSWLWEFGDGDTSKVKEPFHKYMSEGVYDITLWAYLHNVVNGVTITCSSKFVLSPGVTVEPSGVLRFSTVFTPNTGAEVDIDHLPTGGTEIDQFFFPGIREKVIKYKLQIFNRLGVLIFESNDINKPWNGYYHHKLCQQGVYVWYVEGKYANGMPFKKVGDVTLLQ